MLGQSRGLLAATASIVLVVAFLGASTQVSVAEVPFAPFDGLYRLEINGPLATTNGMPTPESPELGQYAVRTNCVPGRCGASGVILDENGLRGFRSPDNFVYDFATSVWNGTSVQSMPCDSSNPFTGYSDTNVSWSMQPWIDGTMRGLVTEVYQTICPRTWQAPVVFSRLGDFPPNVSLT
jgi:hypothetical protein